MKFTLKSDYALNIIAIDKPPKYELKDTCYNRKQPIASLFNSTNCSNAISAFYRKPSAEENLKRNGMAATSISAELDFSLALKAAEKVLCTQDSGKAHRYYPFDDEICPRRKTGSAVSTTLSVESAVSFWISKFCN